jgi:hypothetical protein
MSIYMANVTPRERSKAMAYGLGLGTAGMLTYYLPINKGRYVEAAFNVVKNEALDNIDGLNESALALTKHNKVTPEQKIFLTRLGVNESLADIDAKVKSIKDSITDADTIKAMKQGFADTFEVCKKNVVERDAISMKAFQKIRWTNLAWGAGIGLVTGFVMGMLKAKDPQLSYFE